MISFTIPIIVITLHTMEVMGSWRNTDDLISLNIINTIIQLTITATSMLAPWQQKTLCGFRLLNSLCKKCSQDVNAPYCAYAGSGFWLNANYKRQAQHHSLPNCGRKHASSSCEPTPRLPPELLPEDLWWAPSPGCPPPTPGKEVRSALGGQPHFGTREGDIILRGKGLLSDWHEIWCSAVQRPEQEQLCWTEHNFFMLNRNLRCLIHLKPRNIRKSKSCL